MKIVPARSGDLSDKQSRYIAGLLKGLSSEAAARAAGYAEHAGANVRGSAKVQAEIVSVMERFLLTEAAPRALHTLHSIHLDDRVPPGVRVAAASTLLDRAGLDAKRHARQAEQGKDVTQMSRDELQRQIDQLHQEITGRMVDITPDSEPNGEPLTSQELDMYE